MYVGKQMLMPQRGGKILVRAVNIKLILFYMDIYIYISPPLPICLLLSSPSFFLSVSSLSLSLSPLIPHFFFNKLSRQLRLAQSLISL